MPLLFNIIENVNKCACYKSIFYSSVFTISVLLSSVRIGSPLSNGTSSWLLVAKIPKSYCNIYFLPLAVHLLMIMTIIISKEASHLCFVDCNLNIQQTLHSVLNFFFILENLSFFTGSSYANYKKSPF